MKGKKQSFFTFFIEMNYLFISHKDLKITGISRKIVNSTKFLKHGIIQNQRRQCIKR